MRIIATILMIVSFAGATYVASGRPSMSFLLGQVGVGLGATIPPNPYNTLAEQLTDWQGELDTREQQLDERERAFRDGERRLNSILGTAVIIVALLLGLNFYMDWHRSPRLRSGEKEGREPDQL